MVLDPREPLTSLPAQNIDPSGIDCHCFRSSLRWPLLNGRISISEFLLVAKVGLQAINATVRRLGPDSLACVPLSYDMLSLEFTQWNVTSSIQGKTVAPWARAYRLRVEYMLTVIDSRTPSCI